MITKPLRRFIIILDFSSGRLIKILINDKIEKEIEKCDNIEDFISKYASMLNIRLSDCSYMYTYNLIEENFEIVE